MRATRKISIILGLAATAASTFGFAVAAQATPVPPRADSALYGTWVNLNANSRSVKQVVIAPNDVGSVDVDAFGACVPTYCEWGSVPAIVYGTSVSSPYGLTFQTRQKFLSGGESEWSRTTLFGQVVRIGDDLRLNLREMTTFSDGSGRKNYVVNEQFQLGEPARATIAGYSVPGYRAGYRPKLRVGAFGKWVPVAPSGNLAKLRISGTPAAPVVHGYGSCSPTPCNWGRVRGITYGATISSAKGRTVLGSYNFSFKREQLVIVYHRSRYTGREWLTVSEYSEFTDGSGRSNYSVTETLVRG